jgi:hypothetical protein
MTRLRVREIAEGQGFTMYSLQQKTKLSMGTIRRYWYNSSDGKEGGEPLKVIYLEQLTSVANVLQVAPGDLLVIDYHTEICSHWDLRE